MPISDLPAMPKGLIDAAATNTLVPFVGAGISQLAGCPRWSEFADKALDLLVQAGTLNAAQRSQLGALSPRVKLSVAKLTAKKAGIEIDLRSILQNPNWSSDETGRRVYSHIAALSNRFVTTNYDEWLDVTLPHSGAAPEEPSGSTDHKPDTRRIKLHRPGDITADNFRPNTVVHLHGAIEDPDGMIMSTRDYLAHYANDGQKGVEENPILRFLEYLFANKTVLFLGYGLEELEILEYVILKARHRSDHTKKVTSHYLLQGFFSFESDVCDSLTHYFSEECGIELIPFRRDQNNWAQVIEVLGHFARSLPSTQPVIAQDLAEMEQLINA